MAMIKTNDVKKKDWVGNSKAVFVTNGDSSHSKEDRAQWDYYATEPKATRLLLELEDFSRNIWECAAGEHHIANVLWDAGHYVRCSDIIDRTGDTEIIDFLSYDGEWDGDIISNPPYNQCREFCEKAIETVTDGHKVAMFLKLSFLEGQSRRDFFKKYPPKTVWVSTSRLGCAKNGEFKLDKNGNPKSDSAVAYCWYIWEKGFQGEPTIKWFN